MYNVNCKFYRDGDYHHGAAPKSFFASIAICIDSVKHIDPRVSSNCKLKLEHIKPQIKHIAPPKVQ